MWWDKRRQAREMGAGHFVFQSLLLLLRGISQGGTRGHPKGGCLFDDTLPR